MRKCIDCGFLAIRNGVAFQASPSCRSTGKDSKTVPEFFCYKESGSFNQHKGLKASMGDRLSRRDETNAKENIKKLQTEITCELFTSFVTGKTPKEHEDMLSHQIALQLQSDFRRWQQEQAEKDRSLQRQIAALSEAHHQEDRADFRIRDKIQIGLSVISLIISITAIVVAVCA